MEVAYAFRLQVDSSKFQPLLEALTKSYGQPSALERGKGTDYAQWRFKEGRLEHPHLHAERR